MMKVMRSSVVSFGTCYCLVIIIRKYSLLIESLIGLRSQSHIGKIFHVFTARPTKNCGGNSPLHPLFVCNGETDCTSGIDEINCTHGMNFIILFKIKIYVDIPSSENHK